MYASQSSRATIGTIGRRSASAIVALVYSSSLGAATYVVSNVTDVVGADGVCSLREALRAATQNIAIDICPAGGPEDEIHLGFGVFDFSNGFEPFFDGGRILVAGDPVQTQIDLGGQNDFLRISGGSTVVLYGLDIRRGKADYGGALQVWNANLEMELVEFTDNQSTKFGGALYFDSSIPSSLHLNDVQFNSNMSLSGGAAVITLSSSSDADFRDVAFHSNEATSGNSGALFLSAASDSVVRMFGFTVHGNEATSHSAGVWFRIQDSELLLTRAGISNNSSAPQGSADLPHNLFVEALGSAKVSLDRLYAGWGSGPGADMRVVAAGTSNVTISNAEIGNFAGDGIVATSSGKSSVTLAFCTIAEHYAGVGATLIAEEEGQILVADSIVSLNDVQVLMTASGVSLEENFIGGNPGFVSGHDYRLTPESQAIDACGSPSAPILIADLDSRPRVAGAAPDCGAFESGTGIFADGFESASDASWDCQDC
jgi:predicted outer membrane repeat protein